MCADAIIRSPANCHTWNSCTASTPSTFSSSRCWMASTWKTRHKNEHSADNKWVKICAHLNVRGNRLQQNQSRLAQQWPHRSQHQHDQQHGQRRIHVVLVPPFGQPHHQRTDNHNNAAKRVAQHVQIDAAHVHLRSTAAMAVSVSVASGSFLDDRLLGFGFVHKRVVLVVVGAAGELRQLFMCGVGEAVRVTVIATVF